MCWGRSPRHLGEQPHSGCSTVWNSAPSGPGKKSQINTEVHLGTEPKKWVTICYKENEDSFAFGPAASCCRQDPLDPEAVLHRRRSRLQPAILLSPARPVLPTFTSDPPHCLPLEALRDRRVILWSSRDTFSYLKKQLPLRPLEDTVGRPVGIIWIYMCPKLYIFVAPPATRV